LTALEDEAAGALATFAGPHMYFTSLIPRIGGDVPLTPNMARLLLRCTGGMSLRLEGLESLDGPAAVEAAGILATARQPVSFPKLARMTPAVAAQLAQARWQTLQFDGLGALTPEVARVLAAFRGGELRLDGLTELSTDAARSLADFQGMWLQLNGLKGLPVDTAEVLAAARVGRFSLEGLEALEPAAAAALAGSRAWDGRLPGVTGFETVDSVAVARALAGRQHRLALPNLARISPRTFLALVEMVDVVIPSLDALRFIPEPDGSPTDDFVMPEHFLRRQRLRGR
jgi:hypothetical protein